MRTESRVESVIDHGHTVAAGTGYEGLVGDFNFGAEDPSVAADTRIERQHG